MITTPEQMREAAIAAVETELAKAKSMFANLEHYDLYFDGLQDALIRIRAIRIAPQSVAVTVKPLVWNYSPASYLDCMCHDEFGLYQITDGFVLFAGHSTTGDKHFSIEAAKAAAQADYEARILAALTIQPADPLSDPRVVALVEAARALRHSVCGPTGFAEAVRHNSGKAYPWISLDAAELALTAALRAIGGEA